MRASGFTARLLASRAHPIYSVIGVDGASGRHAYYIIEVDKMKLPVFIRVVETGRIQLTDYGRVITSGFGTEVPEGVIAQYS